MVIGTAGENTGEIRTAETYSSDQYSQIEVTSTQLTGTQWIGVAVRMQSSGQSGYVGHLHLEFRQPPAPAVRQERGQLEPAGQTTAPGRWPPGRS